MDKKIYEQAKKIRQLVYNGKTKKEIVDELGLTDAQIQYRIKKCYAEKTVKSIKKRLKDNKQKSKGITVTLDTSAMEDKKIIKYLFSKGIGKVILTDQILEEMDRHKTEKTSFGQNIRELMRLNAYDKNNDKFEVVFLENKFPKVDHNLVAFCAKNKDILLCTGDFEQAGLAKGKGIKYRLNGEAFEENTTKSQVDEEHKENEDSKNQEDEKLNVRDGITADVTLFKINDVTLGGNNDLLLNIPKDYKERYGYIVLRENKVQNPVANIIRLKIEDNVLIVRYNTKNSALYIFQYEIVKCDLKGQGLLVKKEKIYNPSIEKVKEKFSDFSEEVIRQIKSLLFYIIN